MPFFLKMGFICTAKTVANYKKLRSFLDSAPPKLVKNQIWLHDKFSKFLFLLTSVIYINKGQTNSSKHIHLKCIHSYIQSIIQSFSLYTSLKWSILLPSISSRVLNFVFCFITINSSIFHLLTIHDF